MVADGIENRGNEVKEILRSEALTSSPVHRSFYFDLLSILGRLGDESIVPILREIASKGVDPDCLHLAKSWLKTDWMKIDEENSLH